MFRILFDKRYRQIISTLMRHGFGWLVVKLGFGAFIPFHWGLLGHPRREERYSGPEHLRLAFEELGPTFIKLAQILSTRPDLISLSYAEEFAKLQDRVPPLPFDKMKEVVESDLKEPLDNVFLEFDPKSIASASIGQVYRARLLDGKHVVVKIQKPALKEIIAKDLEILGDVVRRVSRQSELGKRYDLQGFLDEFGFTLINELDYVREGQNADRFRLILKNDPRIFIPAIYWEFTSSRVLVMDEIRGTKVTELNERPPDELDRRELAAAAVEITLKEIFEYGFFHADPHPGNFVIMEDYHLGLMDFGLVGYLDQRYRELFLRFMYKMIKGEVEDMLDALWDLGITGASADRPALKRDFSHLLFRLREISLEEIAAGETVREFVSICYRHQLYFPPDLGLLLKVMAMSEGLGAMIDPQFKLFQFAEPILKRMYLKLYSPENIARKMEEDVVSLIRLVSGSPKRISTLLRNLESGRLQFSARLTGLEDAGKLFQAANRMTTVLLLTLFIIATGIYVLAAHFMGSDFYLVNILLGMVILSGIASVKILFNIWRQRSM